jgi:hypothetical protein
MQCVHNSISLFRGRILFSYQVCCGFPPFAGGRWLPYQIHIQIVRGLRPPRPALDDIKLPLKMPPSDKLWDLITQCWAQDPTLRPSIGEVVEYWGGDSPIGEYILDSL